MSYPPLSDIRNRLDVQWYRSAIDPKRFRELSSRSDLKGWVQAGGHLGFFILTGFKKGRGKYNSTKKKGFTPSLYLFLIFSYNIRRDQLRVIRI